MMDFLLEGVKTGAMIAFPIGPVVVLLFRIGLLKGWGPYLVSAGLTGMSVGVSMAIAVSCVRYIQHFVAMYPMQTHLSLAALVLYTAWRVYHSNKSIKLEDLYTKSAPINIYYPPFLSLICPFTSVLILNIFAGSDMLQCSLDMSKKVALVAGSVVGSFLTYTGFMVALHVISARLSQRAVLYVAKIAPVIVAYYGVRGLIHAFYV